MTNVPSDAQRLLGATLSFCLDKLLLIEKTSLCPRSCQAHPLACQQHAGKLAHSSTVQISEFTQTTESVRDTQPVYQYKNTQFKEVQHFSHATL